MTFESIGATSNANSNAEVLAVKAVCGDEIRRASFSGGAYVALHELVAKLFGLDEAAFVLKYPDEDGDKITMSSDGEVKEALQISKEKKLLRLFVELKAPKVGEAATAPPPPEFPVGGPLGFGVRFGRGAFVHGHHHGSHGPHHGPHRGSHGGFRGCGFGRGGFGMRGGFAHHGRFGPVVAECSPAPNAPIPQACDPNVNYHTPHMVGHGDFTSADGCSQDGNGPYAARCALKEHKHAMKEHIKLMKINARTPDDFAALKDFKQQMKAECKARWHVLKEAKKEVRKDKKCEKRESCDKYNRPYSKHVADVTIPDNSELAADTPVTKTWRLRNEGNMAWPAGSQLIFVSRKGDNLNGPERVLVGSLEPQQEVDVSVTFITPSEPGRYKGYYRMADADGAKFGQRLWVSFIVPTSPLAATLLHDDGRVVASASTDVHMD